MDGTRGHRSFVVGEMAEKLQDSPGLPADVFVDKPCSQHGVNATDRKWVVLFDFADQFAAERLASAGIVFDGFQRFRSHLHPVDEQQALGKVRVFGDPMSEFFGAHTIRVEAVLAFARRAHRRSARAFRACSMVFHVAVEDVLVWPAERTNEFAFARDADRAGTGRGQTQEVVVGAAACRSFAGLFVNTDSAAQRQ